MPVAQIKPAMYYEIHGQGDPLICSGGWGTFCHGGERHVPEGQSTATRYSVRPPGDWRVQRRPQGTGEHRPLRRRCDRPDRTSRPAAGAFGRHRRHRRLYLQGVAIRRPDLVRSLVNSGAWARVDTHFRRQMELWLEVHRTMGFAAFQRLVVIEGSTPPSSTRGPIN